MAKREPDGTVVAARLHLGRGESRIRARARRVGALRGLAAGAIAAALLGVLLRFAPRAGLLPFPDPFDLGAGPRGSLVILAAALLLAGSIAGRLAGGGARTLLRVPARWERALPSREEGEIGLAVAAAPLLAPARAAPSPFELALLSRFLALPLPGEAGLRREIPGLPPLRLAAALLLAALAAGLPLEGRGAGTSTVGGVADGPGDSARSGSVLPPALSTDRIDALRGELAIREGAARLLDGVAALRPLAEALRSGGGLDLPGESVAALGARERAPLRLAAADLRANAARERAEGGEELARRAEAWAERLEAIAAGDLADAGGAPPPRLVDAAAELAALAGAWQEGSGAAGAIAAAAPEGVAGGVASGGERSGLDEGAGSATRPGGEEAPLDLPPGIPIAPGEPRLDGASPSPAVREIDPRDGWLRRSELEPRWFPVIRAYERRMRDAAGEKSAVEPSKGREGGER